MLDVLQIEKPVQKEFLAFKTYFEESLKHDEELLNKILAFIAQGTGKMMRPLLVLLTAKAVGEIKSETIFAATSLELLHTASLVHDDVIDESKLRRGRPSVCNFFDNKSAVLVGDYLLSLALTESVKTNNIRLVQHISELGQTLSEGELLQLHHASSEVLDKATYFNIIRKKTAVLFSACTILGGLSNGVNEETLSILQEIGDLMGMCFQVQDDILDYLQGDIGKPTGHDLKEGKITLPLLCALEKYPDKQMEALALKARKEELSNEEVDVLIQFAIHSKGIELAQKEIQPWIERITYLIHSLSCSSEIKQSLQLYLTYILKRNK